MPDPYNIYTYLMPYLTHGTDTGDELSFEAADWMGNWGMYLTPFDSRETKRVTEIADYDVKDLYREALSNSSQVDAGLGKMGFVSGYGYDTQDRMNQKVADAMQLTSLKALQREADIERQYSSNLYLELGRLADIGAFDLDELLYSGIDHTTRRDARAARTYWTRGSEEEYRVNPNKFMPFFPGSSWEATWGKGRSDEELAAIAAEHRGSYMESVTDPLANFKSAQLLYGHSITGDPYQDMLDRVVKEKAELNPDIVNTRHWSYLGFDSNLPNLGLEDKCQCPDGGYSRSCCGDAVWTGDSLGPVHEGGGANVAEYDPYTGELTYTEEHLADIEAYNAAIGESTYTGLNYSADVSNCMENTTLGPDRCHQIVSVMTDGVTSGNLGLGTYEGYGGGDDIIYDEWGQPVDPGSLSTIHQDMGDYDFLYGEFGSTQQAQDIGTTITECMSATNDYNMMANCLEQGQTAYTQARVNFVSDEQMQEYGRMTTSERSDVRCFGSDHAAYHPTDSSCIAWAKYKGMSAKNFFRKHISQFTNLSYEEWLESVGGSWVGPQGTQQYGSIS